MGSSQCSESECQWTAGAREQKNFGISMAPPETHIRVPHRLTFFYEGGRKEASMQGRLTTRTSERDRPGFWGSQHHARKRPAEVCRKSTAKQYSNVVTVRLHKHSDESWPRTQQTAKTSRSIPERSTTRHAFSYMLRWYAHITPVTERHNMTTQGTKKSREKTRLHAC